MLRFVTVLGTVCIAAALILGAVYNITSPLIAEQKEKETKQALENVVPGADRYNKKSFSKGDYYECYKGKSLIGYALFAVSAGYSSAIKMLVGIDKRGEITGLEVLAQSETPGLGARCDEIKHGAKVPWFLEQFKGKDAAGLKLKDIEAITGATITSKAIVDGVRDYAAEFLQEVR